MRILVVDDEVDIREFVKYNLSKDGHEVTCATNGAEAVEIAPQFKPQLILMDMMMPVMDGCTACRAIRQIPELSNSMIIFLSAVCEEESLLEGYDAGADDYITKPVSMRVLCSRVKAVENRIKERKTATKSSVLNENHRSFITEKGEEVRLAVKEFEILRLLLSESRIFTREEIYNAVWGEAIIVGSRTLDVHIRHIRSKIGEDRISTCKGVGFAYKF